VSLSQDPIAEDATVIFLHVGKTAGATMRRALRKEFPSAEVMELRAPTVAPGRLRRDGAIDYFAALSEAERTRPRLIMGHMTFGLHEVVPRPATYVTLLREPLDLIASQFHHAKRHEGHLLHEEAKGFPDLASYVRSGISLEMDNSQTRAFAGDVSTPFGGCTPTMLGHAKANLERAFAVIGLTERFDESLVLMRRAFDWRKLRYVSVNVDPGRDRRGSLSMDDLDHIRAQNALDLELYAWAAARFDETIRAWPGFGEARAAFLRDNARYQPWGKLAQMPRHLVERLVGRRSA
jgi:Galactose-3-O-sulfotransferase